jgi:orotate phosphoribosyltransferase-like protein
LDPKKSHATIDGVIKLIELSKIEFDTIVFRGMSGALMAPIVAHQLEKFVTICRKPSDDSHAGCGRLEGHVGMKKYIIFDDFISSGKTIQSILDTIKDHYEFENETEPNCVGIFLYRSERSMPFSGKNNRDDIPVFSHTLGMGNKPIFTGVKEA